jgi:F-type H+-transporting ATPase subunit c
MKKEERSMWRKIGVWSAVVFAIALYAGPAFAAGGDESPRTALVKWGLLGGSFALGIAAAVCGLGQGKAIAAACDGIARNPSASGDIRISMIIGLAFIESLVIYTLLISLILTLANPYEKFLV